MSIEDIQARQEAFTKTLAEFQTAMAEAARSASDKLRQLLAEAAGIGADLDAYTPTVPPTPEPPAVHVPVRYGRFAHALDKTTPIPEQAAKWPLQVLQGDEWHLPQLQGLLAQPGTLTLRATTPVARRYGDANGWTQCLPPSEVPDAWMLRNRFGDIIKRERDSDQFLDPGNPDYQRAAAKRMVGVCQEEGWPGVWFDEFNGNPVWSFGDNKNSSDSNIRARDLPVKYPTPYSYRLALRSFIAAVAPVMRSAGLQVWINLAGQFDPKTLEWDAWTTGMAQETDGHCIEFYVARGHEPVASTANGYWQAMLDWTLWQAKIKPKAMFHAMTTDPKLATYALATYLLAGEGNAWFMASQDPYPIGGDVFSTDMVDAQKLGRALGAYTVTDGVYSRRFERGRVLVNPSEKATGGLPATSGAIELRSPGGPTGP